MFYRRWTAACAAGEMIGIGVATISALAMNTWGRRAAEGERVRRDILAALPDADVSVGVCDLGDFASIRRAAGQLLAERPRMDILVHNAGATFPSRTITADGVEATLAVDVMGPHLLTTLLGERLEMSRARVIALTGIYHRKGHVDISDLAFRRRPFEWLAANNQAQRGRFLFIAELARRAPRLSTASVHPGAVLTGAQPRLPWFLKAVVRTVARPAFLRAEVGAIPVLRLAAHPEMPRWTGRFFDRCHLAADVPERAPTDAFWRVCETLTGRRGRMNVPLLRSRGRGATRVERHHQGEVDDSLEQAPGHPCRHAR